MLDKEKIAERLAFAAEVRRSAIEDCARELERSYPGHAWLNAATAAIRSMSRPEGS